MYYFLEAYEQYVWAFFGYPNHSFDGDFYGWIPPKSHRSGNPNYKTADLVLGNCRSLAAVVHPFAGCQSYKYIIYQTGMTAGHGSSDEWVR